MLYLVGGVARSGKTLLARRMLHERGVAYFPTDALMVGFGDALPEFGVAPENPDMANAVLLWPLLEAVARNLRITETSYVLEGVLLLPDGVARLGQDVGPEIRSCFLGYPEAEPNERARLAGAHPSEPGDWLAKHDEEYRLAFIRRMIGASRGI
jgi:hypothetical protein